jgi:hypothetical protein
VNATRIAPGVTTAGVVNPATLLAAHHESVADGDFTAVVNETRRVRRENGTVTLDLGQRFVHDADSGTYLATYRNESARDLSPTVVWGNETAAVARTSAHGHEFYEPVPAPNSSVPTGSSFFLSVFSKYDFDVRAVETLSDADSDSGPDSALDRTRLLLEDDSAGVETTLVLDSSGRIHEFTLSRSGDSGTGIRRMAYRIASDRDVSRLDPAWVVDAPADVHRFVQMGMEVEPNYVYLSHDFGQAIPAGTVVELTTDGETYTTRFGESLHSGQDRQLYVLNGSLVVTSHPPEAQALGENLSSPVRLLLYTEDGVLLYQETFRWSPDERLSIESGAVIRRADSRFRSEPLSVVQSRS